MESWKVKSSSGTGRRRERNLKEKQINKRNKIIPGALYYFLHRVVEAKNVVELVSHLPAALNSVTAISVASCFQLHYGPK